MVGRTRGQKARAEGVFEGCRGLTSELIIGRIEAALEQAFAEGAASSARTARRSALVEMCSALGGVETSIKQHLRTLERELSDMEKKS